MGFVQGAMYGRKTNHTMEEIVHSLCLKRDSGTDVLPWALGKTSANDCFLWIIVIVIPFPIDDAST